MRHEYRLQAISGEELFIQWVALVHAQSETSAPISLKVDSVAFQVVAEW